ncbi:MAG: DNA (cytosine-5-)-methyltransferase [Bacilli bacterium]
MTVNNPTVNLFNFNYPIIKLDKENVKVGTFFSGIGSPEMAFKRLKDNGVINNYESVFFCEVDKYAIKSYCAIHGQSPNKNLGDITKINGADLPYCDIWIGGFPCQDISMAGVRRGFDFNSNTRSSLGWKMIQFLKEVKDPPKVVIFENVAAITNVKMRKTLNLFKEDLESLGYSLYDHVLTALDYGTPQNRERYFLIAIKGNYLYYFPDKIKLKLRLKDLLEKEIDPNLVLSEKVPFDLHSFVENKNYTKNSKLVCKNLKDRRRKYIINLYRFIDGKNHCGRDTSSKYNQTARLWSMNGYCPTLTANSTEDTSKMIIYKDNCFFVKKISPLESWRFMGFSDEDFYKAKSVDISNRQLFKQAGNSIATNVIYYILKKLF